MKQTLSFEFETEKEINLRDVFYTAEFCTTQNYYGVCPACGGAGRVILNGGDYACPACGGRYKTSAGSVVLSAKKYTVKRWRVNKVTIGFDANEWKPPEKNDVFFNCYRAKRGDRFDRESRQLRTSGWRDGGCVKLEFADGTKIHTSYEEAVRLADEKNAESAALVKEYNEKHGTTFEFEKPVYDAKSR